MLSSPQFLDENAEWNTEGQQERTELCSVSEKGPRKIVLRNSSTGDTEKCHLSQFKMKLVHIITITECSSNSSELLTRTISLVPVLSLFPPSCGLSDMYE